MGVYFHNVGIIFADRISWMRIIGMTESVHVLDQGGCSASSLEQREL